jgi:hypothetical protein
MDALSLVALLAIPVMMMIVGKVLAVRLDRRAGATAHGTGTPAPAAARAKAADPVPASGAAPRPVADRAVA